MSQRQKGRCGEGGREGGLCCMDISGDPELSVRGQGAELPLHSI